MRILGIDPGTVRMGYGLLECGEGTVVTVGFGVLSCPPNTPLTNRLYYLHTGLTDLMTQYQPSELAIEEPFVGQNVRSALALGQAQAIAMLAAANHGIAVRGYTPTQVKQAMTDYGRSDKKQIQEMIKIQLNLPTIPQPSDAADALAVALCHLHQKNFNTFIARKDIR